MSDNNTRSDAAAALMKGLEGIDLSSAKIAHLSISTGREFGPKEERDKTRIHMELVVDGDKGKKSDEDKPEDKEEKSDEPKGDKASMLKLAKKLRDQIRDGDDVDEEELAKLPEPMQKALKGRSK